MITKLMLAAALAVAPAVLRAQEPLSVMGRAVTFVPASGPPVRGELLAVRQDSAWVLTARPARIVGVRLMDQQEASVQRHSMTAKKGVIWGLVVGTISGAGLAIACGQVRGDCGSIVPGSILTGLLYGGIAAISLGSSSRWRLSPVTAEGLSRFARFPQGPPAPLDSLLVLPPDSTRP